MGIYNWLGHFTREKGTNRYSNYCITLGYHYVTKIKIIYKYEMFLGSVLKTLSNIYYEEF